MPNTSKLYGQVEGRIPLNQEVDIKIFDPSRPIWVSEFQEPEEAKRLSDKIWADSLQAKAAANSDLVQCTWAGETALYSIKESRLTGWPGYLWSTDDPYEAEKWYATTWKYYFATLNPEYLAILEKNGIQPPIMVGCQLHSPKVSPQLRSGANLNFPGKVNPPSSSMFIPSPGLVARQRIINPYLGKLGVSNADAHLASCRVVLRQLPMPPEAPEHTHLVDYCLESD